MNEADEFAEFFDDCKLLPSVATWELTRLGGWRPSRSTNVLLTVIAAAIVAVMSLVVGSDTWTGSPWLDALMAATLVVGMPIVVPAALLLGGLEWSGAVERGTLGFRLWWIALTVSCWTSFLQGAVTAIRTRRQGRFADLDPFPR